MVQPEVQPEVQPDRKPVAVRSAATVLLIDDRPELQVFMMKRNTNIQFAGGMWVFPGGSVDDSDNAANYSRYCAHRSDASASEELGLAAGGLAYYVAAIREAFEEAGILLALHRDNEAPLRLVDADIRQRFDGLRASVNQGTNDFLGVVEQEDLILDADQHPIPDDNELVSSSWLSPREIIAKVTAKEMGMLPPTLRMVEAIAAFETSKQVMDAAQSNLTDVRVPMTGAGVPAAAMSNAEPGWVRLRPSGSRQ